MNYILLLLIFIVSCAPKGSIGPNYNQSRSHNENILNRHSIVMKEDARSKKQMSKSRKRASRAIKRKRPKNRNINRRLIR